LLTYIFTNNSQAPSLPFSSTAFTWILGTIRRGGQGSEQGGHSFASAGTYNVTLVLNDTGIAITGFADKAGSGFADCQGAV